MTKYIKKPIAIEAVQFNKDGDHPSVYKVKESSTGFAIKTLEGLLEVTPSDYIITGVRGEVYACKEDIFLETYEEVNAEKESE